MEKKKTLIIAEAGDNHNGVPELAFRLVDEAVKAGADVVKFQTFKTKELVMRAAQQAEYQKANTGKVESQYDMIRRLELPDAVFFELAAYCRDKHIGFLSTPFDLPSIELLNRIGLETLKIPSGEITNLPYLRAIGALHKNIILSTGMSTLDEIAAALEVLEAAGTMQERITLLHCTSQYPAPFDSVNLRAMQTMRAAFPRCAGIGYSDHTQGIAVPLAAVAMGAAVIEKHFTLDKNMEGPDHKASLEPTELAAMVEGIRKVEAALGDGKKNPVRCESATAMVARKSLVARRSIKKGEQFTADNITAKRPGTGISPMRWDEFLGKTATRDYAEDELLCEP